jgi:hypothetical protein
VALEEYHQIHEMKGMDKSPYRLFMQMQEVKKQSNPRRTEEHLVTEESKL